MKKLTLLILAITLLLTIVSCGVTEDESSLEAESSSNYEELSHSSLEGNESSMAQESSSHEEESSSSPSLELNYRDELIMHNFDISDGVKITEPIPGDRFATDIASYPRYDDLDILEEDFKKGEISYTGEVKRALIVKSKALSITDCFRDHGFITVEEREMRVRSSFLIIEAAITEVIYQDIEDGAEEYKAGDVVNIRVVHGYDYEQTGLSKGYFLDTSYCPDIGDEHLLYLTMQPEPIKSPSTEVASQITIDNVYYAGLSYKIDDVTKTFTNIENMRKAAPQGKYRRLYPEILEKYYGIPRTETESSSE